jgi:hypothetical protein
MEAAIGSASQLLREWDNRSSNQGVLIGFCPTRWNVYGKIWMSIGIYPIILLPEALTPHLDAKINGSIPTRAAETVIFC